MLGNLRLDGHTFISKRDAVLKPVSNKTGSIEARILSAIIVWVYNELLLLERLQTSCMSNSDRAKQNAPSERGNPLDGKSLSNVADRRIDSETCPESRKHRTLIIDAAGLEKSDQ